MDTVRLSGETGDLGDTPQKRGPLRVYRFGELLRGPKGLFSVMLNHWMSHHRRAIRNLLLRQLRFAPTPTRDLGGVVPGKQGTVPARMGLRRHRRPIGSCPPVDGAPSRCRRAGRCTVASPTSNRGPMSSWHDVAVRSTSKNGLCYICTVYVGHR